MRLNNLVILGITFLALAIISCKPTDNMSKSNFNYTPLWSKVEKLQHEGMLDQVDKTLNEIELAAKQNKDEVQFCRVVLTKMQIGSLDQADFIKEKLPYLEKVLDETQEELCKVLLNYTIGLIYFNYWESNQSQVPPSIGNMNTAEMELKEWSAEIFLSKIDLHFDAALGIKRAKDISVKELPELFDSEETALDYKVWDFIILEKIRIYQSDLVRNHLGGSDNECSVCSLLGKSFRAATITVPKEDNSKAKVADLYQNLQMKLVQYRQNELLIKSEVDKIAFFEVNQNERKQRLLSLRDEYREADKERRIDYELGIITISESHTVVEKQKKAILLEEAKALFQTVISNTNNSSFKQNANLQIEQIELPELSAMIEQVAIPNKPILLHLNYKNIEKVYYRIYRLDLEEYMNPDKNFPNDFKGKDIMIEEGINLPASLYKNVSQSIDIKLNQLPSGYYGIALSNNPKFNDKKKNVIFASHFLVSSLYINHYFNESSDEHILECINRVTGEKIENATFEVYNRIYNSDKRKSEFIEINGAKAGDQFRLPFTSNNRFFPLVRKDGEFFMILNGITHYKYRDRPYQSAEILTDRSIYRPGQEIYFKGFLIAYNNSKIPSASSSEQIKVELYDPFNQKIADKDLKTEKGGAFDGKFEIPSDLQNGNISFRVSTGNKQINVSKYVKVEEYKRPKFKVEFFDSNQQVKLDAQVSATIRAEAFTGITISDAQVRYKVYRNSWFPYFYRGCLGYYPPFNSSKILIESGTTVTDTDGQAEISFVAISDKRQSSTWPNFTYTIEVDVTDGSGETRSATKEINISKFSKFIKLAKGESDNNTYKLSTVNASDQVIASNINAKFYKSSNSNYKIERHWEMPDIVIDDDEMKSSFPDLQWDTDDSKYSALVLEKTFEADSVITIDFLELVEPGDYKLVLTTDDSDTLESFLTINDFKERIFGTEELLYVNLNKSTFEIGEDLQLQVGSSIQNLQIQVLKVRDRKVLFSSWMTLEEINSKIFDINSDDLGGFGIVLRTYYKNRAFEWTYQIDVPWKMKALHIQTKTIRYVTEPGASEKWSFIVKDGNGNPVRSDFITSMYDASLDAIFPNNWSFSLYPQFYSNLYDSKFSFGVEYLYGNNYEWNALSGYMQAIPGTPYYKYVPQQFYGRPGILMDAVAAPMESKIRRKGNATPQSVPVLRQEAEADSFNDDNSITPTDPIPSNIRTNLSELVFFYPNLETDESGHVEFEFDMNEALTKWKLQNLAITPDLEYGFSSEEIITKKDLMIQANQVRFLRVGDKIKLSAKLINLSERNQKVNASIYILDNETGKAIQGLEMMNSSRDISLEVGEKIDLDWTLNVPNFLGNYKIIYSAKSEDHEDAEQHIIPAVPNDIYLTESKSFLLRPGEEVVYNVDEMLKESKKTTTLTIETTGSPAWHAMRSLPYLMEADNESSEAVYNRIFANVLAQKMIKDNTLIAAYYREWEKKADLESALKKNQELKNVSLHSSPWLKDALDEEETMKDLAMLFNDLKLEQEIKAAIDKLKNLQLSNGGLSWFPGGRDNYYISQYVLQGFVRLEKLGIDLIKYDIKGFQSTLYSYCQARSMEQYQLWNDKKYSKIPDQLLNHIVIYDHFGSLGSERNGYQQMINEIESRITKNWTEYSLTGQVNIAKILVKRDRPLAEKIVQSIYERSYFKEQLGRFWNKQTNNIYSSWAISLQAEMIELFDLIGRSSDEIDEMKTWLIVNKRTNSWKSSIATSSAIYALNLGKKSAFSEGLPVSTSINSVPLTYDFDSKGINYNKQSIKGKDEVEKVEEVSFSNKNENISWANIHHQFFQEYEDIERTDKEYFDIKKEIFKVGAKDELYSVEGLRLKKGDKIKVRLRLETDRPMQFIHIVDGRPSGAEPAESLSGYQWEDGMSYYKSIKDLGTHFYIDYLEKGKYMIEYEMFINNSGVYNSGIAQVQNMYAPEFNDYSKNMKISVD